MFSLRHLEQLEEEMPQTLVCCRGELSTYPQAKDFPFLYPMPDPSVGSLGTRTQRVANHTRCERLVPGLCPEAATVSALERSLLSTAFGRVAQSLRRQNSLDWAPATS